MLHVGVLPHFGRERELRVFGGPVVGHVPRRGSLLFGIFCVVDVGGELADHALEGDGLVGAAVPLRAGRDGHGGPVHGEDYAEGVLHVLDELADGPVREHAGDVERGAHVGDEDIAERVLVGLEVAEVGGVPRGPDDALDHFEEVGLWRDGPDVGRSASTGVGVVFGEPAS